ncbi:PAS domain-containing protein, partial [Methylophaga muralis]|uniref:PAS domain-containing protein n=1 Tax=Methylophaga muralis TaxID=291169 RepID=UPI00114CA8AB
MEHPVSGVFLAKFIFEISDVRYICTHAEGNIDLLTGCSPEEFLAQQLKLTDLFHPADEDIAVELFSNTSAYVDKAFTFRLISPIESRVIIVKSVSNKLVDSTGLHRLELSLFFSTSSEP